MPHALLLSGMAGLGKRQFAEQLAALLLCESPVESSGGVAGILHACGGCSGCRWLGTDSHPDLRCVSPDGEEAEDGSGGALTENDVASVSRKSKKPASHQIRIDAIRALEDFVFVGSHRQGRRVILITDAGAMNPAATNALLKILEEPPASVYFILITNNIKRLLPTLRSRCRLLNFVRPPPEQAAAWLQQAGLPKGIDRYLSLAGGAPLQLARWHDTGQLPGLEALLDSFRQAEMDPLALAACWDALLKRDESLRLDFLVDAVQRWLVDGSLQAIGGGAHYKVLGSVAAPASGANSITLLAGWRELMRFRRSARHPLNQLLFLEDLASHTLRALGKLAPPGRTTA